MFHDLLNSAYLLYSVNKFSFYFNPLSANPTEWSNTLKLRWQQRTNCLSVFAHFVGLVLKGLGYAVGVSHITLMESISVNSVFTR